MQNRALNINSVMCRLYAGWAEQGVSVVRFQPIANTYGYFVVFGGFKDPQNCVQSTLKTCILGTRMKETFC